MEQRPMPKSETLSIKTREVKENMTGKKRGLGVGTNKLKR